MRKDKGHDSRMFLVKEQFYNSAVSESIASALTLKISIKARNKLRLFA